MPRILTRCVYALLICLFLKPWRNVSLTYLMFFALTRYDTAENHASLEQDLKLTWEGVSHNIVLNLGQIKLFYSPIIDFCLFIYFYYFLIFIFTLFYFTILYWFCHALTWHCLALPMGYHKNSPEVTWSLLWTPTLQTS